MLSPHGDQEILADDQLLVFSDREVKNALYYNRMLKGKDGGFHLPADADPEVKLGHTGQQRDSSGDWKKVPKDHYGERQGGEEDERGRTSLGHRGGEGHGVFRLRRAARAFRLRRAAFPAIFARRPPRAQRRPAENGPRS